LKRITTQELAALCGVSRGTVDRALNGRGGVNPQTQEKILAMAKKHNYRPNFIGQALSSKRTRTIGVVIFDFRHGFFAELYTAFEREAESFNYVTLPMLSYHDPEREMECIQRLTDRNVDGLIILPVNAGPKYEAFLKSLDMPVVCIGNRLSANFPFSGIDDRRAAHDAIAHLVKNGCDQVFYYCPPIAKRGTGNLHAQEQRLLGYEDGLADLDIAGEAVTDLDRLIQNLKQIDGKKRVAVLCSNDIYAIKLQFLLRDQHEDLFQRVRIMGFDGLDVLKFSYPPLPSVEFSRNEWALKAFGQIYQMLSGKSAEDEVLEHRIVESPSGAFK
jgi:DNA-binding LacI/PurR family transcriptional regulator